MIFSEYKKAINALPDFVNEMDWFDVLIAQCGDYLIFAHSTQAVNFWNVKSQAWEEMKMVMSQEPTYTWISS